MVVEEKERYLKRIWCCIQTAVKQLPFPRVLSVGTEIYWRENLAVVFFDK